MEIVDFHNHYYPPEYLKAIQKGPSNLRLTYDSEQNPVLHYPGDSNIVVPGHRDIQYRQEVLDEIGVGCQVLTFTSPGTHIESEARAVALARMVNESMAQIVYDRGTRFRSLATLPLNAPDSAVQELENCLDTLGFEGAMLFSNVNGVALSDERFWPLYELASERKAVLYIHPIHPVGVEAMVDYWLMPLVGFPLDTTLAAAQLVFSGVVKRFSGIRWVLAHLGGAIPYLAERLDRGYEAFAECRHNISRPPSHYLREFYLDTVNFDSGALQLALNFVGEDRLLAGSDYPHQIGSLEKMVSSIKTMQISEAARQKILAGNARRLLKL